MSDVKPISDVNIVSGLAELAPDYDALLCDIWGVVHNGQEPFEAAVEALQVYRQKGGRVVLITNAPRPSASLNQQFDTIGVPHDTYDLKVSSGDVAEPASRPATPSTMRARSALSPGTTDSIAARTAFASAPTSIPRCARSASASGAKVARLASLH